MTGARRSSPEEAYARLGAAITSGEFAPGQRLVEAELVEEFGVSRGAVRTALTRLEQEGLVVREPHRGARVRKLGIEEAVEITETRAVLEGLAARYAARHASDVDVAGLRRILEQMRTRLAEGDLIGYSEGNARLHAQVIEVSRNATLQRLIAGLKAQIVRFQFRTIFVAGRREESLREHTGIVEAIAAHDQDAAESAMRLHVSHVARALSSTAAARAMVTVTLAGIPDTEREGRMS